MENKIRTTIYVDRTLMDLARIEVDNLSELISILLSQYLSTNSTEEIDKQIKKLTEKVKVLETKKADLIRSGISEEKTAGMNENMLNQVRDIYVKRRGQLGENQSADEQWILSSKNLQKCKILGKEPLVFLAELREWYEQRSN